jgi:hypothetical protein
VTTRHDAHVRIAIHLRGLVFAGVFSLAVVTAMVPRVHAAALAPGDLMPSMRGELLDGRKVTLPDSTHHAGALLVMGFSYESRHDVEAWVARYRRDFGSDTSLRWFEIPIIGGASRLARPFIDSGMRRGTPRELHGNVITLYRDSRLWKERMACADPDVAYLLLIDGAGRVVWRGHGPLTDVAYDALAKTLRERPR